MFSSAADDCPCGAPRTARRAADDCFPKTTHSRGAVLQNRMNFFGKFKLQLVSDCECRGKKETTRTVSSSGAFLSHHIQGSHEIFITAGGTYCNPRSGRLRKNVRHPACRRTGGSGSRPCRSFRRHWRDWLHRFYRFNRYDGCSSWRHRGYRCHGRYRFGWL